MAHYFTREEAEALLPQITVVLREIQVKRESILQTQEELEALNFLIRRMPCVNCLNNWLDLDVY